MTGLFIDIHALQTVAPSNLNRDDSGAPKTAFYGGAERHRVSSQAWKRAARTRFHDLDAALPLGVRSRRHAEVIAQKVIAAAPEREREEVLAQTLKVMAGAGLGKEGKDGATAALVFLSESQVQAIADAVLTGAKLTAKDLKAVGGADLDVALFGSMFASERALDVDAAAQVAHAIGVGSAQIDYDYYAAKDDVAGDDDGAAMIGTLPMVSSTLYRYANVDVAALRGNLGADTQLEHGVALFLRAFLTSIPTGKQNGYAAQSLPEYVRVVVRTDRPLSLAGAFLDPIEGEGTRAGAATALETEREDLDALYGAGAVLFTGVAALGTIARALGQESLSVEELIEKTIASLPVQEG